MDIHENRIDAALCARMFLAGAKNLESKKEWINTLNVFPVPDGDTGTNMTMTILSAVKEIEGMADIDMSRLAKAMSSGSLRGARGNSGVILSQLLRGLCKVIRDYEVLDVKILTAAFEKSVETAYKAVMKPKEGTILTVARAFSEKATELYQNNAEISLEEFIGGSLDYAKEMLEKTPEMLPVLKEAGVVDSGGQGLVQMLQGAYDAMRGIEPEVVPELEETKDGTAVSAFTYCVQFMLHPSQDLSERLMEKLHFLFSELGELEELGKEDNRVYLHVHTEQPGQVLEKALIQGSLTEIRIANMHQHENCEHPVSADHHEGKQEVSVSHEEESGAAGEHTEHKSIGFVSVAAGAGLAGIFRDLGVDCVIEGGQTMNPSTEDVINAVEAVNADTVFVFPNNKNIILAATQAQNLVKDKKVIVIPTKTIPQGITAMVNYVEDKAPEENESAMYEEIRHVKTCQLTYAVRDTHVNDLEIHQGDYMGVGDKGILAVGTQLEKTALDTVAKMIDDESELVSVYYGAEVTEEAAGALEEQLKEAFPSCEIEVSRGDQPVYYYIISVE